MGKEKSDRSEEEWKSGKVTDGAWWGTLIVVEKFEEGKSSSPYKPRIQDRNCCRSNLNRKRLLPLLLGRGWDTYLNRKRLIRYLVYVRPGKNLDVGALERLKSGENGRYRDGGVSLVRGQESGSKGSQVRAELRISHRH
jgi:hypothetical protein